MSLKFENKSINGKVSYYVNLLSSIIGIVGLARFEDFLLNKRISKCEVINNLGAFYDAALDVANVETVVDISKSPLFMKPLWMFRPKHVKIIDSGLAVARQTKNILGSVFFDHLLRDQLLTGVSYSPIDQKFIKSCQVGRIGYQADGWIH